MSIFSRIRQFIRAVRARLTLADSKYILEHLSDAPQELFFEMSIVDQVHCLRTAYTIEKLILEDKYEVDREFMIRCALLHDVGRCDGDLSVLGKIFAVIITTFAPKFADFLEIHGNHALYVYHNHAQFSGQKLQKIGFFKEAKIVSKHHAPPNYNDPIELKLLRLADNRN